MYLVVVAPPAKHSHQSTAQSVVRLESKELVFIWALKSALEPLVKGVDQVVQDLLSLALAHFFAGQVCLLCGSRLHVSGRWWHPVKQPSITEDYFVLKC